MTRHWIYVGGDYYGPRDRRRDNPPLWHWSPDADSYSEAALCGEVFPGSPHVSAEPPAADQPICPGCAIARDS